MDVDGVDGGIIDVLVELILANEPEGRVLFVCADRNVSWLALSPSGSMHRIFSHELRSLTLRKTHKMPAEPHLS